MSLRTPMVFLIAIPMKLRNLHRQQWTVPAILQQLFPHHAPMAITVPRLSGHLTVWSLVNQAPTLTTIPHRLWPAHRVKPNVCCAQQVCNVLQALKRQQGQQTKEVFTQSTTRDISRSTIAQVVLSPLRETQRDHSLSALSAPPVHTARTAQQRPLHAPIMPTVLLEVQYSLTVPWTIWMWIQAVNQLVTARRAQQTICALEAQSRLHVLQALLDHGILIILWMTLDQWYANR